METISTKALLIGMVLLSIASPLLRSLPSVAKAARTTPMAPENTKTATPRLVRQSPKLMFSGYEWRVKQGDEKMGPGPNFYSDNPGNAFVDKDGRLHLRITHEGSVWRCAEVISKKIFGYGTYRFYVDSNVDTLDPQIVLGMFTWSDDPEYNNREIDIEVARWGHEEAKNGQYVIPPNTGPDKVSFFNIPPQLPATVHSFTWKAGQVLCESVAGKSATPANPSALIHRRTLVKDIPPHGDEHVNINLWLFQGKPPSDGKAVEIVISKFEFVPAK